VQDECHTDQHLVEIKVVESTCEKMPAGGTIVLKGPVVDYRRSGPICLSAANAIYPWIMLTRFGVKAPELDYDADLGGYPLVCPCGIVRFEVRELAE